MTPAQRALDVAQAIGNGIACAVLAIIGLILGCDLSCRTGHSASRRGRRDVTLRRLARAG